MHNEQLYITNVCVFIYIRTIIHKEYTQSTMIKQLPMDAHELNFSPPIHEQLLTDA